MTVGRSGAQWRFQDRVTEPPGTVVTITHEAIHVATGDGILAVMELQPANSRRMAVSQYLSGHHVSIGLQLGKDRPFPSTRPVIIQSDFLRL